MNPETLKALFPNASESTLRANTDAGIYPPMPAPISSAAPRRLGSGLEDRFAREQLPGLLSGGECVRRQFRVRVSSDDSIVQVHYTCDFAIWHQGFPACGWFCTFWEIKDARRKPHSDELTRPKMVRLMNPWVSAVWLATWDGHEWKTRQLA